MKAFLLDIDYETHDNKAVLHLYMIDENSKELHIYDKNFQPYFYVLPGKDIEELKEDIIKAGAEGVEIVEKRLLGKQVTALKVYARHPKEVPELRKTVKNIEGVDLTLEYDILFTRRYLIDKKIKPFNWYEFEVEEEDGKLYIKKIKETKGDIPELRVTALDIEVYNPRGAPRPEKDPIIMVSLASSNGLKKVLTWKTIKKPPEYVEVLKDEKEMLKRLEEILNSEDIDVIAGYNTDNFDFPYIKKRLKALSLDLKFGKSEIEIRGRKDLPEARIKGKPHIDLYPIIRRNVKLNSYVLENVAREILKEEKEKIPNDNIWIFWDKGGEKLRELLKYSLEDAVVTLRLSEKFLPLYIKLSWLVGQSLYDVARMTTGQLVEWYLMRIASDANELIPNRPKGTEISRRFTATYVGGYVKEPEKGIVEDIAVFDFRSLYPSIIVTHNIDPSTLIIGDCTENKVPGLEYCFSKEKKGFIPMILEDLIKSRSQIKKKLKSCEDEVERKILDVTQYALKILANSFYGYMGYPRARWYRRECAESVAAFARHYIKEVMALAEEKFNLKVVYGDTDSLFIVLPGKDKAIAMEFLKYVNSTMPGIIELEFEGFYKRAIFVTKKRYALLSEDGKITVKGLEFVRRDWAPIARRTQQKVIEILLKEGNPEKAVQLIRSVIEDIKNRKVKLEDVTIYTQITKKIESYEGAEPHVAAAKKLQEAGVKVKPGMIIGYIVTRGGKKISSRTTPVELARVEDYDPDYYIDNQILPAVLRIFEALGYNKDFLKTGIKQKSLSSWF